MAERTEIVVCYNLKCVFNRGGYCDRHTIDINTYGGCAYYAIVTELFEAERLIEYDVDKVVEELEAEKSIKTDTIALSDAEANMIIDKAIDIVKRRIK